MYHILKAFRKSALILFAFLSINKYPLFPILFEASSSISYMPLHNSWESPSSQTDSSLFLPDTNNLSPWYCSFLKLAWKYRQRSFSVCSNLFFPSTCIRHCLWSLPLHQTMKVLRYKFSISVQQAFDKYWTPFSPMAFSALYYCLYWYQAWKI